MTDRRIRQLSFGPDSYEISSEDNSSATVSVATGLVNIEPGNDSLPHWCLSPQYVIGFESAQTGDAISRSIFLIFRTDAGEKHKLFLGSLQDVGAVETWVARANSIYPQSRTIQSRGNLIVAQVPPHSGTPFLDDLVDSGSLTLIPGIYGNMIPRSGRYVSAKPYKPYWLEEFSHTALKTARQVTGYQQEFKLETAFPPGLDSDALMFTLDLVRPSTLRGQRSDHVPRAVLSGEFLFEHPQSRPQVKVLPFSQATHLALLVRIDSRFYKSLKSPRSPLRRTERGASLSDWLKVLSGFMEKNRRIPIITHEREVAYNHLMEVSVSLGAEWAAFDKFTAASVTSIAELLHRFRNDDAVAVCDIGAANEVALFYKDYYRSAVQDFAQLRPRYTMPVNVGLGLPREDPIWCEVGAQALQETLHSSSPQVQNSLMETRNRLEQSLGMQWAA